MTEPKWVDERDALALHDRLLQLFGGAPGMRDQALLESALTRARQIFVYDDAADILRMAAAYTYGIVKNHPFIDGNKRTGFLAGVLFLELNRYRFIATEEDAIQAVLALATGTLDEAGFTAWLRANTQPQ